MFSESVQVMKDFITQSSQPPATYSLLGPNTLSLCFSLSMRYQVSHPYKERVKLWFCIS